MLAQKRRKNPELTEAQQNAASIWDAPLPDGPAQLVLIALALTHHDVYCYQSGGRLGTWVVWIGDLASVRVDRNGRLTLDEWQANYPAILAEIGYTGQTEGGDACTER